MPSNINQIPKQLETVQKSLKDSYKNLVDLNKSLNAVQLNESVIKNLFGGDLKKFESMKKKMGDLEKTLKNLL
jgi:hypothetical protein